MRGLDFGASLAARSGDMVDHRDNAARLRRLEHRRRHRVRIDPRQVELGALPVSVVIDQMKEHEIISVGGQRNRGRRRVIESGVRVPLADSGEGGPDPFVGAETWRIPAGHRSLGTDRLGHDLGIISVAGEVIEHPVAALEPQPVQHLDRLSHFVELARGVGPSARGDSGGDVSRLRLGQAADRERK